MLLPLEDVDIVASQKEIVQQCESLRLPVTYSIKHGVECLELATVTFVVTALGKDVVTIGQSFPASSEDQAQIAAFFKKMPILVEQGKLVQNPMKLWPGGLAAIPEGLKYMEEGKQSAEKIVFSL